jgi:hypothetical protein
MYGIGRDDPMVQDAGSVRTPVSPCISFIQDSQTNMLQPGRMIVFPNIYQHRVGSFSLKDRSKPGHRKILVFFLVDPTQRIVSTATVPPQDISWGDTKLMDKVASDLPLKLQK